MQEKIKTIRKAVVPVAGLGTRFLPFTKSVPKEMLPIVDTPAIEFIVNELVGSGIEDILLINGRHKAAMIDYFDRSPELELELIEKGKTSELELVEKIAEIARIHSVRQKTPLGLGHAILCAEAFIGEEPFAVLLGDDVIYNPGDPAIFQLIEAYKKTGKAIIGVQEVPWNDASRYGIVNVKDLSVPVSQVTSMVEKPENPKSNLAIIGRYILPPEIFSILKETPKGVGGEIQLTDALIELLQKEPVYACKIEGRHYDIGSKQGFLEATVETALRREDLREPFLSYLKTLFQNLDG